MTVSLVKSDILYDAIHIVLYHSGGSMKLNACNLLLARMVYLKPKHNPFISHIHTIVWYILYIQDNDTKHMAQPLLTPLASSPCQFPLITPFVPEFLLLTWKPSFLCGAILVHPGPRLIVNWPPPPHSLFPPPNGFPNSIVRPSKTTSRHWLHLVRNTYL